MIQNLKLLFSSTPKLMALTGLHLVTSPQKPNVVTFAIPDKDISGGDDSGVTVVFEKYVRLDCLPLDLQTKIRNHLKEEMLKGNK